MLVGAASKGKVPDHRQNFGYRENSQKLGVAVLAPLSVTGTGALLQRVLGEEMRPAMYRLPDAVAHDMGLVVVGYRRRAARVVYNILLDVYEAVEEGGEVAVTCRDLPEASRSCLVIEITRAAISITRQRQPAHRVTSKNADRVGSAATRSAGKLASEERTREKSCATHASPSAILNSTGASSAASSVRSRSRERAPTNAR
jgi:hypothetical protein